jgi:hypothetical protein
MPLCIKYAFYDARRCSVATDTNEATSFNINGSHHTDLLRTDSKSDSNPLLSPMADSLNPASTSTAGLVN